MIVFAAKISVKKIAIGLAALCAVIWGISALTPRAAQSVAASTGEIAQNLETNAERIAYLRAFGWEPAAAPAVEMEVQIPKAFDEAYTEYNALQQKQGLDLTKYRGKHATLYSYPLQSYPGNVEDVTASLVLYKNRVIAADISSADTNGFIHGIAEHPSAQTTAPRQEQQPDAPTPAQEDAAAQPPSASDIPESAPDGTLTQPPAT